MMRKNDNLEYEFLPDALEVSESPPSPLPSVIVGMVFLIILTAIVWACLGEVDVVAVARGKVIPDGRLKVIQPLEEGVVTAIYVEEGQKVKEGEILVELDSSIKKVDEESIIKMLEIAKTERALLQRLFNGVDISSEIGKADLSEEFKSVLMKLSKTRMENYNIKNKITSLQIEQGKKDIDIENSEIAILEKSIEILSKEEQSLKKLYEQHAIPKKDWEDKYNELVLQNKKYDSEKEKLKQYETKLQELFVNSDGMVNQKDMELLDLIVEKDKQINTIEAELTKSRKSMDYQTLKSPVSGIINGLSSNTIGGVVTPAQPIVTIVPEGTPLIIEAAVLNKDIGFVKAGQKVAVKVDTFPFQQYGTLEGEVINISPDVFADEKLGEIYKMKVKLIEVDKKQNIHISPGMQVTSEIKTGKRKIIEFFLDPLIKYAEESLKLR